MEHKRSLILIRVAAAVLLFALLLCLGALAYRSLNGGEQSVVATLSTWRQSVEITGLIVREETVLSSRSLYTAVTAPNGRRAAAGDTLGLAYSSRAELERARRMEDLEEHIALAEEVLSGVEEHTAAERAEDARSAVLSLSGDIARHDMSALRGDALRLRSLLFESGAEVTRQELDDLRGELRDMEAQGVSAAEELISPASGYFTALLDGSESLSPAVLSNMTVGSLTRLSRRSGGVDGRSYGKLVTGSAWYLAALMDAEEAGALSVGDELSLDLSRYRSGQCPVKVVSVSPESEGQRAVVFAAERCFAETLSLRLLECPLVLQSVTGLRLPAEALQQGEGGYYVTVDTGSAGRRCAVELLYDGGEYVLVQGTGLSEGSAVELHSGR